MTETDYEHKSDPELHDTKHERKISNDRKKKYSLRNKQRYKSTTDNLELNEEQLCDYLSIIRPNEEELKQFFIEFCKDDTPDITAKLESVTEDHQIEGSPKKYRSSDSISSIKSSQKLKECNSVKRIKLSRSLTSLTEFMCTLKKTLSLSEVSSALTTFLNKSDESGYGNDSTKRNVNSPKCFKRSDITDATSIFDNEQDMKSTTNASEKLCKIPPGKKKTDNFLGTDTKHKVNKDNKVTLLSPFDENKQVSLKDNIEKRIFKESSTGPRYDENDKISKDSAVIDKKTINHSHLYSSKSIFNSSFNNNKIKSTEKEYKCVRLKPETNAPIGIYISPTNMCNNRSCSYVITKITPKSIAAK